MFLERDPFAPRFEIFVNSERLPDRIKNFITNIKVEDDADLFDKISFTIGASEVTSDEQVIDIIDSKLFKPSNVISVKMGYGQSIQTVGGAEIVKVQPKFGKEGVTLEVTAYDPFHRLANKKHRNARPFSRETVSAIFKRVLGGHSEIFGSFDSSKLNPEKNTKETLDQAIGKSDFEFLKKLADNRGFEFFNRFNEKTNKFDVFISEPNDNQKPSFTFKYFSHDDEAVSTLLDFQPDNNLMDQISDLEIISWKRDTKVNIKTYIQVKNDDGSSSVKFRGPDKNKPVEKGKIVFRAFGERFEHIVSKPFESEKGAKLYAEAWLKYMVNNFITGTAELVGIEALRSRDVIRFEGLGRTYDGDYYVNSVEHDMSDGNVYASKVNVRKIIK